MSSDSHNAPEQNEKAIARLAADEMRADSGTPDLCPDAEALAAYADHTLDPEQTARCESHLAGCARCRKILAALVVSEAEPLLQQEVQKLGQRAAAPGPVAVPSRSVPSKQPAVMPRRSNARWAVPAIAAAAAVILWFALRPKSPAADFVAQNVPVANSVAPDVPAADSPAENSQFPDAAQPDSALSRPEIAQSDIPPPPAAGFAPQTPGQSPAGQSSFGQESGFALDRTKQEAPVAASPAARAAAAGAFSAARTEVSTPPQSVPPEKTADTLSAAKSMAVGGAAANNAPAGLLSSRIAQAQGLRTSVAPLPVEEEKPAPLFAFSSPGGAQWRGGTAGLIEHSLDQGRTWLLQSSGVKLDLAAGSAASDQVAWIVGHAGVILRTTDGASWQRVTSPNTTITDWTAVQVADAQHATITARDQRRFTTADGGQSWTPQP